jgi:hypothetical protein
MWRLIIGVANFPAGGKFKNLIAKLGWQLAIRYTEDASKIILDTRMIIGLFPILELALERMHR